MPNPPCKDCPRRKIGCHDVDICQPWREYTEAKQAVKAKMEEQAEKTDDWYRHLMRRGVSVGMKTKR